MRNFPQEIVDLVIDMLAESLEKTCGPSTARHPISGYSTVSSQWVRRTQYHHFKLLRFASELDLDKWRAVVDNPDTSRASKYVRALLFFKIHSLEGFGDHLRAFTEVETATFYYGTIFSFKISPLESIGSSLVNLEINIMHAAPELLVRLLASLPRLRRFHAFALTCDRFYNSRAPRLSIPFFEGANDFRLLSVYSPCIIGWIPPTARFSSLSVGTACAGDNPEVLNEWIASSSKSLKHMGFIPDWTPQNSHFGPLDFSGCTSLETLQFPAFLTDPQTLADAILPSITSSELSTVVLHLDPVDRWIDPPRWRTLEKHLSRLAKRFKMAHGGRMMVVEIHVLENHGLFQELQRKPPMPGLDEDARVTVQFICQRSATTWPPPHPNLTVNMCEIGPSAFAQ